MRLSIAIDGPAGAGKSTIAKLVADKLNIMYINTGLMYRSVTFKAMEMNIPPSDIEKLCSMIDKMDMYFDKDEIIVDGVNLTECLSGNEINKNVSLYASIPEVRERLVKMQRQIASKFDIIMDGRDIGTVVLKDAAFKFFVTASPEERAMRRLKELTYKGIETNFDEVLLDIINRDYKDTTREVNPLTKAEDSVEIDTTGCSIDEIINKILAYIQKNLASI